MKSDEPARCRVQGDWGASTVCYDRVDELQLFGMD